MPALARKHWIPGSIGISLWAFMTMTIFSQNTGPGVSATTFMTDAALENFAS